jgi:hypothetical protein
MYLKTFISEKSFESGKAATIPEIGRYYNLAILLPDTKRMTLYIMNGYKFHNL